MIFRRKNRRKKTQQQLFWLATKIIFFAGFLALLVWGFSKINPLEFLEVEITWELEDDLPISKNALQSQIEGFLQNRYLLDLQKIRRKITQQVWVDEVKIKRLFWNKIHIKVSTKKAALRFGKIGYISTKGVLFTPRKLSKKNRNLPIVVGENEPLKVRQLFNDFQHYQELITPHKIKSLHRTQIDTLIISPNISLILGQKNQSLRLAKFKKIARRLRSTIKKSKSTTFDMRYPDGFSIKYDKP